MAGRRRVVLLPRPYQDLLEVVSDASCPRPLRTAEIAAEAGLATGKATAEGLRSKLKRLAGPGRLAEEAGGLFTPPARTVAGGGHRRYDA